MTTLNPSPLLSNAIAISRVAAPGLGLVLSGTLVGFTFWTFPLLRNALLAKPAGASSASDTSGGLSSVSQSERTAYVLAQIRYLFSVGSHTVVPAIATSSALFAFLAFQLPGKRHLLSIAAGSIFSIAPLTQFYMFPAVNKRLIELDEKVKKSNDAKGIDAEEVDEAMNKFENIHNVRSGLALVGSLVGLYALVL